MSILSAFELKENTFFLLSIDTAVDCGHLKIWIAEDNSLEASYSRAFKLTEYINAHFSRMITTETESYPVDNQSSVSSTSNSFFSAFSNFTFSQLYNLHIGPWAILKGDAEY